MKIKTDKTIDMTKGPLLPSMAAFALPMILSNLLQIAFNAADTVVVGQFVGQDALAAVGATTPIVNLLVGFFLGLSTGANIVIAMQIGKKEAGRISLSVHTSVFTALTGGVILTIFGLAASPLLLNLCGTPQNIIGQSTLYLRIYFAGSVPLLVYNFGAAILRAGGDTVSPTIYMTISGTLNAALNLFFVLQLHMGVEGVAIATVISESVSAVLVMRELMRRRDASQFMWSKLRADRALLGQILLIGVPTGLQSTMWALSNMAVQTSINSFGSTAVAGNSAAYTLETFLYTAMQAFTQACIT
ncbi:MAG: MATE family efflux transporter, partial [Lachnospiraceae bacterium]|nr:MATE family efflux transporter [Lachnospiraceae bacterium]